MWRTTGQVPHVTNAPHRVAFGSRDGKGGRNSNPTVTCNKGRAFHGLGDLWIFGRRFKRVLSQPVRCDDISFPGILGLDEGWIPLGKTPVTQRRPLGLMRWRTTKDGYDPIEVAPNEGILSFNLVPHGTSLPGMVHVPAGSYELESEGKTVDLSEYWLDKYEVTNREFKRSLMQAGTAIHSFGRSRSLEMVARFRGSKRWRSFATLPVARGHQLGNLVATRMGKMTGR